MGNKKMREVRSMVQGLRIDLLCIQETKMEIICTDGIRNIGGSTLQGWHFKTAEMLEGGLLVMCGSNLVESFEEVV